MFGQNTTSDKELLKNVNRRLQRSGSQAGVAANVQNGTVTITGKLRLEDQRLTIIKAVRGVNGVRNVIDQLQSPPKKQPQRSQPTSPSSLMPNLVGPDEVNSTPLIASEGSDNAALPTVE
jgi:hypothetical protein